MKYLSLCSGIEAATVAWERLGWEAVAFAEIERFPCAVLAHHYPDVPNVGDMTKIDRSQLCAGSENGCRDGKTFWRDRDDVQKIWRVRHGRRV